MKRRAGFLLSFLLLTACGFSPIYGDHGADEPAVTQALGGIYIESIPDQSGQFLRNKLMDRFYYQGRPATPTSYLSVSVQTTETDLGIQKDATATRSRMDMTAKYTLRDTNKKALVSGTAHSVASYSKLAAQYGTLATQRNANERALTEISEQIANHISLYFAEHEPPAPKDSPSKPQPTAP